MVTRWTELCVGIFMLLAVGCALFLAMHVSGITHWGRSHYYALTAEFSNIGGLKVRAPVVVSGVAVGQVAQIELDPQSFRAKVTLDIEDRVKRFPIDTSASILTQGLLGANYISLTPGYEHQTLASGDQIETTHSALILENLIGKLLFGSTPEKAGKTSTPANGTHK